MEDNLNLFGFGQLPKKEIVREASIKNIVKKIQDLDHKYNYDEIFFDWVRCMFYTYTNTCNKVGYSDREEKFKRIVDKHGKEVIEVFLECHAELVMLFEKEIDDYLGKIYHELGIHNKMKGQFFTPFHLSKLMAETRVNELIKELNSKKRIKITDAACGSGCLMLGILAVLKEKGINYQKRIFINCSDLDENTIQMAYVQLTIVGAKAKCENKNSLTGEIFGRWDTFNYSISGNTSLDLEVDYGRYKE